MDVKGLTLTKLRELAREMNIQGRSKMNKDELITAIEALSQAQEPAKTPQTNQNKDSYINNAKVGMLVAFNVSEVKVLSGKIIEIKKEHFVIETKRGPVFYVSKSNILWVKTGPRWPKGVYLALIGEA